jgi:FAD/FMN-containing dehydrogenase
MCSFEGFPSILQVLALTLVLANGTLRTLTPEGDPFLMRAARVAVGQLGIITSLRLR